MLKTTDERMRELQSTEPYASATRLTKSGNDADVTQNGQTFASTSLKFNLNRTHSFATTYYCIQLSTII